MSAVLDTPLNGLGMVPLVSEVEGMVMSQSYKDALNTVVNACRGTETHGPQGFSRAVIYHWWSMRVLQVLRGVLYNNNNNNNGQRLNNLQ